MGHALSDLIAGNEVRSPSHWHSQWHPGRNGVFKTYRILLLLLLPCLACRARPDTRRDLVEADLRAKETQNRDLQVRADAAEAQAKALENALQQRQPTPGAPDQSISVVLKDIKLGTGTGGLDEDGIPGDEGFQVVVVPRDEDGSPLKVPGILKIYASQVTETGTKESLGAWQVDGTSLRKSWKSGLFSTGYYIPVQWQKVPTTNRVRVVVQMTTLDNRTFEAEKEFPIKLAK